MSRRKTGVQAILQGVDKQNVDTLFSNLACTDADPQDAPPELDIGLWDHQKVALGWLTKREGSKREEDNSINGSILGLGAGHGKTALAICLLFARPPRNTAVKTTLVVCKPNGLDHWIREFNKWIRCKCMPKVCVYHGTNKPGYGEMKACDIVLTTYNTLARDTAKSDFTRDGATWFRVIIDEAQEIENENSKTAEVVHKLKAPNRLCLTSSLPKTGDGIRSVLKFCGVDTHGGLKAALSEAMLRHTKFAVGTSPPIPENRFLELLPVERAEYLALEERMKELLKGKKPTKMMRHWFKTLRKLCCKQLLDSEGEDATSQNSSEAEQIYIRQIGNYTPENGIEGASSVEQQSVGPSIKMRAVLDILKENPQEKTLVFSEFPSLLKLTEAFIKEKQPGWGCTSYDGSMNQKNRSDCLKKFKTSANCNVMFLTFKTGGVGLDLVEATRIIFLEPVLDLQVLEQAIARVYRIGQINPVKVCRLVLKDTVEERAVNMMDRNVALQVMGGRVACDKVDQDCAALPIVLGISN